MRKTRRLIRCGQRPTGDCPQCLAEDVCFAMLSVKKLEVAPIMGGSWAMPKKAANAQCWYHGPLHIKSSLSDVSFRCRHHEIENSLPKIIVIGVDIRRCRCVSAGDERNLGLLGFALLASLVGRLLLLHLLVAQCRQGARNLLDLIAWEVLSQLLCELL